MRNRPPHRALRHAARAIAVVPALLVVAAATPAMAVAPSSWGPAPKVNLLYAVLVLGGIPLALFVIIWALAYATSDDHRQSYRPGLAWRNEPVWFGGPRGGLAALEADAADPVEETAEQGGASARW